MQPDPQPVVVPDEHHIWPLEYGGPNVPGNRVVVCPNGHRNIHTYIQTVRAGGPAVKVTRRERQLAEQGLAAIAAAQRTPLVTGDPMPVSNDPADPAPDQLAGDHDQAGT